MKSSLIRSLALVMSLVMLLCAGSAFAESAEEAPALRHVIIDTDAGSDDSAAMMMAASSEDLDILGVTVLYGNVPLPNAAENAMMVMEVCGLNVPVCIGAANPLDKEREQMVSVHGEDGMGDQDLIHPAGKISEQGAIDFILEQVKALPDEVEIIAIGPLTNIAMALQQDPDTMSHVKHLWIMGTTGCYGQGNATPVAEFNVYSDPKAYDIVMSSGLSMTVVGLDCMVDGTYLTRDQWTALLEGNEKGAFTAKAFTKLLTFYESLGSAMGLPDPLAVAAMIWPDYVLETAHCHAEVCTDENEPCYGQVIFYQEGKVYEAMPEIGAYNVEVVTLVDAQLFMEDFLALFTSATESSN